MPVVHVFPVFLLIRLLDESQILSGVGIRSIPLCTCEAEVPFQKQQYSNMPVSNL